MTWLDRGACVGQDADLWVPQQDGHVTNDPCCYEAARAICCQCPVVDECLSWALATAEPYGMWGGLTPQERERFIPVRLRPRSGVTKAPVCPSGAHPWAMAS